GSGTFYYVAALLGTSPGVTVTPAVLLGDRIKVSSVRLDGRTLVVELLDRPAGQPMTASPTVAVTKRFGLSGGALVAQEPRRAPPRRGRARCDGGRRRIRAHTR